jgi:hypothetical protein
VEEGLSAILVGMLNPRQNEGGQLHAIGEEGGAGRLDVPCFQLARECDGLEERDRRERASSSFHLSFLLSFDGIFQLNRLVIISFRQTRYHCPVRLPSRMHRSPPDALVRHKLAAEP